MKITTELQQDNDSNHLVRIQQALVLQTWTSNRHKTDRHQYRQLVNYEYGEETRYERMTDERINNFRRSSAFMEWETPSRSGLLMLVGATNPGISQFKHHCWISPLALDLIDRLGDSAGANPHASYLFPFGRQVSMFFAMPVLLLQLLRHKRKQLGDPEQREDLLANINAYIELRQRESEDLKLLEQKIEALEKLVALVIRLFKPQDTVYLVLDRVDLCPEDEQDDLMRILTCMIKQAACSVKVLIVADVTMWKVSDRSVSVGCQATFKRAVMQQNVRRHIGY